MSATVREARMMEQRMVPPCTPHLPATPGRVCRMGRCAPFFVWKSPGSTEPRAARPTRASFPAPFLRALPFFGQVGIVHHIEEEVLRPVLQLVDIDVLLFAGPAHEDIALSLIHISCSVISMKILPELPMWIPHTRSRRLRS